MTTASHLDEPIDGRTARAVRTKDAIVAACIDLIDEGDLRPTGPRIAERAGVSVRSIFQHFDDLDALFSAVGEHVVLRISDLVTTIDPADPLDRRIEAMVDQRTQVLEALTPILRAALVHAAGSVVIRQQFEDGHAFFRAQVARTFERELATSPDAEELRQALVALLSWPTWDVLRGAQGLEPAEARRVVGWMVRSALSAARPGA